MARASSPNLRPARTVRQSRTQRVEVVLPNDTNPLGDLLGGKVMHWIDITAAIAAHRHSRSVVVTASMDSLQFLHPIKMGDLVLMDAWVNCAFRTSMEVEVQVSSENILTGKRKKTSTAFLTFVALDQNGQPTEIPPLKPVTAAEKRRYREAQQRRRERLRSRAPFR